MLKETLASGCTRIDSALERLLPPETQLPTSIHKAMRHSVFAGGKRLRPILCMEATRMVQRDLPAGELPERVAELGSALEMLHTYSLIHDDLPALDNDDLRHVTQSSVQLGKTAGKDTASEKATYPAVFGMDESLRRADALIAAGCSALDSFGPRAATLKALAHFLVERKS